MTHTRRCHKILQLYYDVNGCTSFPCTSTTLGNELSNLQQRGTTTKPRDPSDNETVRDSTLPGPADRAAVLNQRGMGRYYFWIHTYLTEILHYFT